MLVNGLTILVVALSLILSACQTSSYQRSNKGLDVPDPNYQSNQRYRSNENYRARPGLTSRERFRYALKLLNEDQAAEALVELETYLLDRPRDARAKRLVKQITLPTSELYPSKSFPVVLEWGQTLSSLSRDYLGDVFSFYGLAKYNGIPVSTALRVGDTINIPATPQALAFRESLLTGYPVVTQPSEVEDSSSSSEEDAMIGSEIDDEFASPPLSTETEDIALVPPVLEPTLQPDTDQTELDQQSPDPQEPGTSSLAEEDIPAGINGQTAASEPVAGNNHQTSSLLDAIDGDPEAFIRKAVDRERFMVAAATLDELRAKDQLSSQMLLDAPGIYQRAARLMEIEDPVLASRYHFSAGELVLARGDRDAAFPILRRSVALDPDNDKAAQAYNKTKARLASSYHRLATNAYRKQELDEAISLWEYVLEIDPNYSAAKTFLVQANELKAKLAKIRDQ